MALAVFPTLTNLAWPVKWSPRWSYNKQDALSGARTRTSYETYPTYDAEVAFNVLRFTDNTWQQIQGFINAASGGVGLWLYNNPIDNTATSQSFGAGDGVSTSFQLVRTLGGFTEPVFFPNAISSIQVNGTPTGAYTVTDTGIIVFSSAPASSATLTWSGTYWWGCRFDDDVFGFENFMQYLLSMKSMKFSTEKIRNSLSVA
jgi:uncharacterized protein (TIGR02217 family)